MVGQSQFELLCARLRAGDAEAIASLLKDYLPHVERVVARWLRRARIRLDCETSDLCQSAVRRLLERHDRFRFGSDKEFVQYVVRSAENLARMKQRAHHPTDSRLTLFWQLR